MTQPELDELPAALRATVASYWADMQQQNRALPSVLLAEMPRVWAGSDYVATQMVRSAELTEWLAAPGTLDASLFQANWPARLNTLLQNVQDEAELGRLLRQVRTYQMCRIIWRDLTRRANYADTVADLSLMAECLIDAALSKLTEWAEKEQGTPRDSEGNPVRLVVLAMGKLGAHELNLSSDIDLIFTYACDGTLTHNGRDIPFQQFFIRLGQQLIRALDQNTQDGFVFRVDMRLRPWGKSGALVIGFDAMEGYYEREGREWERYALIKMRPVAGDVAAGMQLRERLMPFVFRHYLDYGAFEHLRDMKRLIEREVRNRGNQTDIKLGAGGIREIEFIVQAFQLIRGGQKVSLREPNLLKVLPLLASDGLLPDNVVTELRDAYIFFRNVEHCLQAQADKQTQRLPQDEDGWERLAYSMHHADRDEFENRLEEYRRRVRWHFSQVVAEETNGSAGQSDDDHEFSTVWRGDIDAEAAAKLLQHYGIADAASMVATLAEFRDSQAVATMQKVARERLDRLMPPLLESLVYQGAGEVTLVRLLAFLDAVLRRSAYIALLLENPTAMTQWVKLSAASPFIADRLTRYPVLLDELVDVRSLYSPPPRRQLEDELRQHLLRLPEQDLEQQMDALRTFKQAHLLRVAASEITGAMPLMQVSDYLTWLAEAVLGKVVEIAWDDLVVKHGKPGGEEGDNPHPEFLVLGYGKLGSLELSHTSDLDLVFVHDGTDDGRTDGDKPISNERFFARLGQRIIHILTTRTLSGPLYDIDLRLRPSGASGLLVTSMQAFSRYQRESAWVWEQQALVRVRPVAGSLVLAKSFAQLRRDILCRQRQQDSLQNDVIAMRERMLSHEAHPDDSRFYLKKDAGGIVDIEFMVQYSVLRWASQYPQLTDYTDNVRLLETLAALDLIPAADAGLLREAYLAFRAAVHTQSLKNEPACVPPDSFNELRAGVSAIWQHWFVARDGSC